MLTSRSQRRRIVIGAICAVAALGVLAGFTANALAISAPIHIANTGGEGVFIRPEPNTSKPALGWMPEGASPDYHCFAWGQVINGVPIWFNVTYNGVTGFYASYYDDSSYHSNEELTAKYGVPLCGAAPPPPPAPTPPPPAPAPPAPSSPPPSPAPPANGNLVYSIFNAEGGIYFRNSPSWSDTSRITGVGIYNNDQVQLICGAFGEPYGPYANRWWSYVQNLTRSSAGKGWVNAHFINDGMPANTPSPGEGTCGAGTTGAPSGGAGSGVPPTPAPPRSVFYWPRLGVKDRPANIWMNVSDLDFDYPQWASGNCNPLPPGPIQIPASVNTLAGWSVGRLGPIYFLKDFPGQWPQISNIILFDPGSKSEMEGAEGCDAMLTSPPISQLLVSWLKSPGDHRLLVLTGIRSEDWDAVLKGVGIGKAHFSGLWHYYFSDLWSQPWSVRSRVQVCDYDDLAHEAVLDDFYQIVKATGLGIQASGCPVSPAAPNPVPWNP